MDNYRYNTFVLLMKYIKNKIYNLNVVKCDGELIKFYDDFKKINDEESNIFYNDNFSRISPLNTLSFNKLYKRDIFYDKEIILEKYFDTNGELHIFDIFIYQSINDKGIISGKKVEYSLYEIKNMYKNIVSSNGLKIFTTFKNLVLVDSKCSICNITKSLFNKNKNKVIEKKIKENNKINNFYNYYKNTCPLKELHNYKNSNVCTKCGIDSMKKSITIFNKYEKKYNADKSSKNKILSNFINQKKYIHNHKLGKSIKKWDYTITNIKSITNIFNINYNIWSNLGSSYKYEFSKIEKKKCNPMNDISGENDIKQRCSVVKSYIKNIPIIINKILNHTLITNIAYDLKNILNKINIVDLNSKINISDFNSDFNIKYEHYLLHESNIIIYNYLLDSLSLYLLTFYKKLSDIKVNVSKEIVLFIINQIITTEKSFSKIDINNYKLTFIKLDDLIEDDIIDDSNDVIDVDYVDGLDGENDDIDDEYDDFARNDIDIEKEDTDDDTNLNADF